MMTLFKKALLVTMFAALALALNVRPAAAAQILLTHSNINGTTQTYATVDYTLSGQTATFIFTAASGYLLMDSSAAALNINSTSFTESFLTPPGSFKSWDTSNSNIDGFGNFNLALNLNGGFGDGTSSLSFMVTNTSSTLWSTTADVLFTNTTGGSALSHIAPIALGGVCTGFASNGTTSTTTIPTECTTSVPDGGMTMSLLGLGLGALGFGVRRKK